ncbi:MAG: ligase [Ferruginibacter sp.]|nr:ligase [Ferruginibacter sp.]
MLCTLTREVPTGAEFIHEVKWDGYRIIGYKHKSNVRLASRNGLNYSDKYPQIVAAMKQLAHDAVFDGEIVVHNDKGLPDFDALQSFRGAQPIYYYVFDILWLDGYDLKALPLLERKAILKDLVAGNEGFKYSDHFADGKALFDQMEKIGMEGIVSKDGGSSYSEGLRGRSWLKTPTEKRQEFIIGGWIESDTNPYFKTLLFGAYNGKKLEWIGHSGSGYKNKDMPGILKMLQAIETDKNPFSNKVDSKGRIHWVKPTLVANFKFATWTKAGRIRKPATFLGWRKDKKAQDVVREVPAELLPTNDARKTPAKKKARLTMTDSNWKKVEAQQYKQSSDIGIEDCSINFTDVDREIWPGISKAALIDYYHSISPYILRHLEDRPLSLHVKLINARAPGFYIKDMEGREPGCSGIFSTPRKHKTPGKRNTIDYLVCNNLPTLLYLVNLGCIDINPWTSRRTDPAHPDFIVIDLDPSDDDFSKAIKAAIATKQVLDQRKLKGFIKTSGKTGFHILLPCQGFSFAQARMIAEKICTDVHQLLPSITTTQVSVSSRGDKLYLDPNQNDEADTIASAYSARPAHGPTVSTPLDWKELTPKLDMNSFTIHTIPARLEKKGDLHKNSLDAAIRKKNTAILTNIYLS